MSMILPCPRPSVRHRRLESRPRERIRQRISSISVAAAGAGGDSSVEKCLFVRRSVAPGAIVEHSGNVVVFGNVESGGAVSAAGDVIVLGKLYGVCQAGKNSIVFSSSREVSSRIEISSNTKVPVRKPGNENDSAAAIPTLPRVESGSLVRRILACSSMATRAAFFTGAYIAIAGILFFVFPETLFGLLFKLDYVARGWIQATGILAVVFGIYYIGTAIGDVYGIHSSSAFYLSTVVGRIFLFLGFSWLVAAKACPPPLLIVAALNLAGALYMLVSLKIAKTKFR